MKKEILVPLWTPQPNLHLLVAILAGAPLWERQNRDSSNSGTTSSGSTPCSS